MILLTLKEYYDRLETDSKSDIAPEGWEYKEIPFIIVLDHHGDLIQIEDTRELENKKKRAKRFLVPHSVKRTVGIEANLLWDNPGYLFGIDKKNNPQRASAQRQAFLDRLKNEIGDTDAAKPVIRFIESRPLERLQREACWQEIIDTNANVSFRYADKNELVCNDPSLHAAVDRKCKPGQFQDTCLITGERDAIATLHDPIKNVFGAQSSGANIVSFNQESFRSFGKEQGDNAPIGESAAFRYVAALNRLLERGSQQNLTIGDTSMVFWSEKQTSFESDFSWFFTEPPKDDPSRSTRSLQALMESVNTGAYREDRGETRFYVLGLAPNASRISIRFWETGTVSEFASKIRMHFEDFEIHKPESEPRYYSLWRILVNIAAQDKSKNIIPNIAGDFLRAALNGMPYPNSLFQAALRRIHNDVDYRVKPVRAALIKAYLNRFMRFYRVNNHKEIAMSLDKDQPSVGYQLGRLFATLEKIQEEANPGLNSTIRERYYASAATNPVSVFGNLMRLKNHHMAKLDSHGRSIYFDSLLAEIIDHFSDFPAHLDLHEQGRFAIGYYHQRQVFFTKKSDRIQN